jgi:hypothetical protein
MNVTPANHHGLLGATTKHRGQSSHPIVIPAQAGTQRNSLDTGLLRYDKMAFHMEAGIRIFQGFLDPRLRRDDGIEEFCNRLNVGLRFPPAVAAFGPHPFCC